LCNHIVPRSKFKKNVSKSVAKIASREPSSVNYNSRIMVAPKIIRKIKHFKKELIERLNQAKTTFAIIDKNFDDRVTVNAIKYNNDHNNKEMRMNMKGIQEKLAFIDNMGQAKKLNYGRHSHESNLTSIIILVFETSSNKNGGTVTYIDENRTNNLTISGNDIFNNRGSFERLEETKDSKLEMQKHINKKMSSCVKESNKGLKLIDTDILHIKEGFAIKEEFESFTSKNEKAGAKTMDKRNHNNNNDSYDWKKIVDQSTTDKVPDDSTINRYERELSSIFE
jgi:hypothetical protein